MSTKIFNDKLISVVNLLKWTYGILAMVAGLDKFFNLLTDWEKYLHPEIVELIPFEPHTFMMMVGVIEIIAGIVVFLKSSLGGYIVAIWLTLIALSLLATENYIDVAVRDLVMAIGAFSLGQLAQTFHDEP